MSTSNRATSWWASSSLRGRLTAVGAGVLVLGLTTTSIVVWVSPANPVSQALERSAATKSAVVNERNKLLSEVVKLRGDLADSKADLTSTKSAMAGIQQALWSTKGALDALVASQGSGPGEGTVRKPKPAVAGPVAIDAPTKAEIINPASSWFGIYTDQAPFNWATFDATATTIGSMPNAVGYFGGWDEDFRANAVTRAWEHGTLPILTWESRPIAAKNDEVEAPEYSLPLIIGDPAAGVPGTFDDYLHKYARDIVATGLPLGIRLNHEMNGVWYPWSETTGSGAPINGNRPGDYVKMWQHVHDIFEAEGANELVSWIWAPNIINNLPASHKTSAFLDGLYPGDAYVDWVGLSGYLRPPYKADNDFTFDYTFGATLAELRRITDKPILLAEIGASETDGHKVAWVRSLFAALAKPENEDIVGLSWFSLAVTTYVEGELSTNDWRITSRPATTAEFRAGLARPDSDFALAPK